MNQSSQPPPPPPPPPPPSFFQSNHKKHKRSSASPFRSSSSPYQHPVQTLTASAAIKMDSQSHSHHYQSHHLMQHVPQQTKSSSQLRRSGSKSNHMKSTSEFDSTKLRKKMSFQVSSSSNHHHNYYPNSQHQIKCSTLELNRTRLYQQAKYQNGDLRRQPRSSRSTHNLNCIPSSSTTNLSKDYEKPFLVMLNNTGGNNINNSHQNSCQHSQLKYQQQTQPQHPQQIHQSSQSSIHQSQSLLQSNNASNAIVGNGYLKPKIYLQNNYERVMRQKSDNSEPILESSKHQYHHSSLSSLQNFNQQSPPHSQQYRSAVLASTKSSLNDNGQNKNEHPSSSSSALFDGSKKKSRYILFSQLYLIVHISLAICLSQTKEIRSSLSDQIDPKSILFIVDIFVFYILIGAMIFFASIRYYSSKSARNNLSFNELTEQTPILYGAIALGFSELIGCFLELVDCIKSEMTLIPIIKLIYHICFMHFLLTQTAHNNHIGLRNIAIAHLISAQVSLWILSEPSDPFINQISLSSSNRSLETINGENCDHLIDFRVLKQLFINGDFSGKNLQINSSSSSNLSSIISNHTDWLAMFFDNTSWTTIYVLNNQYKFFTIFILITMWFANNQSKINFIRAKLSEEEVIRIAYLNPESKRFLFRGFFIGSIFLMMALFTMAFNRNKLAYFSISMLIQIIITLISIVGLLIRHQQIDSNDPKYQINILKHHFIIFVTLLLIYLVSFSNLFSIGFDYMSLTTKIFGEKANASDSSLVNVSSSYTSVRNPHQNGSIWIWLSILNNLTLLIQVTIQTYFLRLQGKKLITMTHIFSLLTIANFSLWLIDLSNIISDRSLWPINIQSSSSSSIQSSTSSLTIVGSNLTTIDSINRTLFIDRKYDFDDKMVQDFNLKNYINIFVPANRYYFALIFFHFWKLRM